jgi:hypothetical protein
MTTSVFITYWKNKLRFIVILIRWWLNGQPAPPPHFIKRRTVNIAGRSIGARLFIETGTYQGEMVEFAKKRFDRIISIELEPNLYAQAVSRFAVEKHIEILLGDSAKLLPELLRRPETHQSTVFWLDGHYSCGITGRGDKDTPILEELETILGRNERDVILIDDARCFNGEGDYPRLEKIVEAIRLRRPDLIVKVKNDIIHLTPGN